MKGNIICYHPNLFDLQQKAQCLLVPVPWHGDEAQDLVETSFKTKQTMVRKPGRRRGVRLAVALEVQHHRLGGHY